MDEPQDGLMTFQTNSHAGTSKMLWLIWMWQAAFVIGLVQGQAYNGDLSTTSYHLCAGNETVLWNRVLSYESSYVQKRSCGGWLPWKTCEVTLYRIAYRTESVSDVKQVTKCCDGYEQVGRYCALSLARSTEFPAKPGSCPTGAVKGPNSVSQCKWDIDCSGWQKCCPDLSCSHCLDPIPPTAQGWRLNVTVTLKMEYNLLVALEGAMLNHTRLLYSMVAGALGSSNVSVHHIVSWQAGLLMTSSSLLIGSLEDFSLPNITGKLHHLLQRIDEVVAVQVEDIDECANVHFNGCPPQESCFNTVGSYTCHRSNSTVPPCLGVNMCLNSTNGPLAQKTMNYTEPPVFLPQFTTSSISPSGNTHGTHFVTETPTYTDIARKFQPFPKNISCNSTALLTDIKVSNVTGSSFHLSWNIKSESSPAFTMVILKGPVQIKRMESSLTEIEVTELQPGVLYTVGLSAHMCDNVTTTAELNVKTEAQILQAAIHLTNIQFTVALMNPQNPEFQNLSMEIKQEIVRSLSPEMLPWVNSGQVRVLITGFAPGSVVVNFTIVFMPSEGLNTSTMTTVSSSLMYSLQQSTKYTVDNGSIIIQDLNECLTGETDCSSYARCVNTLGSFTCVCHPGFLDTNPSRPGRTCSTLSLTSTKSYSTTPLTSPNDTATSTTPPGSAQMFRTTEQPGASASLTTPITTSTLSTTHLPSHTTATASPVQEISHATGITVECMQESVSVTVAYDFLQAHHISEQSLYLGIPKCGEKRHNATHVQINARWGECESKITLDGSHSSVEVTLYNDLSVDRPLAHLTVPILCVYKNNVTISTGYSPAGYVMINYPVEGSGTFHATVRLLNGSVPLPENYTLSAQEKVVVEVGVNSSLSQIKVVMNKCWVTKNSDPSDQSKHLFLDNSCPVPETQTTVLQNGESSNSRLSVKILSLVDFSVIYLHCQVQICFETGQFSCKPDCSNRAFRLANDIGAVKASCGPYFRSENEVSGSDSLQNLQIAGYAVLGVGLVLFFLAGFLGLFCYKKRVGDYNFTAKQKQEDFTYIAFNT
ncbi:uromodulin-like 1 isoform X2 [Denticeps clupeoides]|uniref:uromodulin-like 1 isoform X2 n=1 Tax=Denticeps clupeoides TaxID=299321 RepID=UPI0010A56872|nr:uromodulin-like 1 isoform X2 [Denticeps clupeoides]